MRLEYSETNLMDKKISKLYKQSDSFENVEDSQDEKLRANSLDTIFSNAKKKNNKVELA